MVQAARSGKQNILAGSQASGTSKKMEIKLTNVARASLEELLEDYRDFLRVRGLEEWTRDHPYTKRLRELNRQPGADYDTFRKGIEHDDPAVTANVIIGLIKVTTSQAVTAQGIVLRSPVFPGKCLFGTTYYTMALGIPDGLMMTLLVHILTCLFHQGIQKAELLCVDEFPGIVPFNGLGQLQPSQLASLYGQRRPVTDAQYRKGNILRYVRTCELPANHEG